MTLSSPSPRARRWPWIYVVQGILALVIVTGGLLVYRAAAGSPTLAFAVLDGAVAAVAIPLITLLARRRRPRR